MLFDSIKFPRRTHFLGCSSGLRVERFTQNTDLLNGISLVLGKKSSGFKGVRMFGLFDTISKKGPKKLNPEIRNVVCK